MSFAMRRCITLTLPCLIAVWFAAPTTAEEKAVSPNRARVLILGDSISIGYTATVRKELEDVAIVVRAMRVGKIENCAGTTNGLKQVDRWLAQDGGKWDVIHFNFGLHDLKRVDPKTGRNSNSAGDPRQAEPDKYEEQLRTITKKIIAASGTNARIIYAFTTPVPKAVKPRRDIEDPARYNAIAKKVMAELKVQINDLYSFALPQLAEIQRPANVHFTPEGSQRLGKQVAAVIREALK